MSFEHPQFLWLVLVLLPWYLVGRAQLTRLKSFRMAILGGAVAEAHNNVVSDQSVVWQRVFGRRRFALYSGAAFILCAVVALAGPSLGNRYVSVLIKDAELAWVLDVSNSMLLDTGSGSRLQAAVQLADRVSAANPQSRNSLTVFKGDALLLVPSTGVQQAFLDGLSWASPDLMTSPGSNLTSALKLLSQRGGKGLSRLVIVLTDGHDTGQDTKQAALRLAGSGDRLVFVGFGGVEALPVRTLSGRQVLDQYGQPVRLDQNTSGLQSLADSVNGMYLDASQQNPAVLVSRLSALVREQLGEPGSTVLRSSPVSHSALFMILALCFFAITVWHSRVAMLAKRKRR